MLQGCAEDRKFRLEAEQLWDSRGFASLEAKVLREEVAYGPQII